MRRIQQKILIGGAWPYANGSLHIGHLAALLPGDVLARYHRLKGDDVYYVSGSDCHGTPVAIRAKQEEKNPEAISDSYHLEFKHCFEKLGFSYDCYLKTSGKEHRDFVTDFHKKLYESPYIFEAQSLQPYCENCHTFLADRFLIGICPVCGEEARGDQCDACGKVIETGSLLHSKCSICGSSASLKNTEHLYIALSKLEQELSDYLIAHSNWRKNAIAFSNRYLEEGLKDRAITRDLDWGIPVPMKDYENKSIYIWAENVLGYLSASKTAASQRGTDFKLLWGDTAKHYYVHGKDNIPFHTIILSGLLLAHGEGLRLPDEIISCEYVTLEGRKISTSKNYAIWVKDIVSRYSPDSLRYFFIANGPEKRDTDFSWREFIHSHNSELLGAYGNFINRTFAFLHKFFDNKVTFGVLEKGIETYIKDLYTTTGEKIEKGHFKDALDDIFTFVRYSNKYFDTEKPWVTRTENIIACQNTLYNCTQIIANLSILLSPFLPFSSAKIIEWLELKKEWEPDFVPSDFRLPDTEILFERIDKKVIEEETAKLNLL
jgi:methionyl-tRNA synthetase